MKLRILDNKVRIRISQDELNKLASKNAISSQTHFPSQSLQIIVVPTNSESIKLDFLKNSIHLDIPINKIQLLKETQKVGFTHKIELNNRILEILFEKDFKCLTKRGEDESNLFENPGEYH